MTIPKIQYHNNPLIYNEKNFIIKVFIIDINGNETIIKTNKFHNIFHLKKLLNIDNELIGNIKIYSLNRNSIPDYLMLNSLDTNILFVNKFIKKNI